MERQMDTLKAQAVVARNRKLLRYSYKSLRDGYISYLSLVAYLSIYRQSDSTKDYERVYPESITGGKEPYESKYVQVQREKERDRQGEKERRRQKEL